MAIRHGQVGMGQLTMDLANQAGQANTARRAADLAEQLRQRELDRQQQAEQFNMQLAAQREMKQLDFQMEMEKYRRANVWEIEKMELRSRLDFENEERKRQQRIAEFDAQEKAIDEAVKTGQLTSEQAQKQKSALQYGRLGLEGVAAQVMHPEPKDDLMSQLFQNATDPSQVNGGTATTQAAVPAAPKRQFQGLVVPDSGRLSTMNTNTGTLEEIDPTKYYTIVRVNPETGVEETGVASGRGLLEDPSSVVDIVNEYQRYPNSVGQMSSVQQKLMQSFLAKPTMRLSPNNPYDPTDVGPIKKYESLDNMEKTWQNLVSKKATVTKNFADLGYKILEQKSAAANPEQVSRILRLIQETQRKQ